MAIVIVGASQGLGEALAHSFYDRGHQVVAASRNETRLQAMKESRPHMRIFSCDVTEPESMRSLVDYSLAEFSSISTLIYVAGVNFDDVVADWHDTTVFRKVIEINLIGAANALHSFLDALCASPRASVVAITSLAGVFGCVPGGTAYAASKAGLDAFFTSAAPEMKALGIKTLIVDPGSMKMSDASTSRQVLGSGSRYREARLRDQRGRPVEDVADRICEAVERGKHGRMWSTFRIFVLAGLTVKLFFPSIMERLALRVRFKHGGSLPIRLRGKSAESRDA